MQHQPVERFAVIVFAISFFGDFCSTKRAGGKFFLPTAFPDCDDKFFERFIRTRLIKT